MELRNRVRYRLSADAVFAWEGAKDARLLGDGITRDISITGAFVFTTTSPPVGTIVHLDVFLSSRQGRGPERSVRIETEAEVVRVEHSAMAEGFAAVSRDFRLMFDRDRRNSVCVSSVEQFHGDSARD
jgi:PilZ domain